MKETIVAIITTLCLAKSSCSDWRLNIVNTSPYYLHVSDTLQKDDFNPIPSNIRPLTAQTLGLRFNDKNNSQIEYGIRLKLYFVKDLDRVELVDVKHDANISYTYDTQIHTLVIRATYPEIDEFSFIISSDPQPFRLNNDGDPNAQRSLWLKTTKPVFDRIAKEETDAHLMIVNGDLTEFGRTSQIKTFLNAVSEVRIPLVCGLGNHDYENNVEDCADIDPPGDSTDQNSMKTGSPPDDSYSDWFPSSQVEWMGTDLKKLVKKIEGSTHFPGYLERIRNLCARRMVQRMRDHQRYLMNFLPDFSWDEESLAYAWNYGSLLRFVQLQYHPNYAISLRGFLSSTIEIKSSLNWLIADMNEFKNRSYVVNVHDAMSHADLQELRPHFGRIKAIFAGHTHLAGVKCFKGIKIFDSGALFKNEFLRVNFSGGGQCLDVLHFVENKYISPLATNYCFQSVLEDPC